MQWRIEWEINMKYIVRDICSSEWAGFSMAGGYWRPHRQRRPHQPGSVQAFGVAENPFRNYLHQTKVFLPHCFQIKTPDIQTGIVVVVLARKS